MVCCAVAAGCAASPAAVRPGPIHTPQDVWAGFDPAAEPLEIETIRRWMEGGSCLHEFYFTGETYKGEKVRIYAIYGAPASAGKGKKAKKLPGVLHIHGGGQTAALPWVKFWNERGYAALTFNWGGEWPNRQRYALWGKLRHCNHKHAGKKLNAVRPTPRVSSWYHWTKVSRRALTVLERQAEVDRRRLGIFGISMGGTIVWKVAGIDKRVKCACAIYGVGWNTYPASRYDKDRRAADAETLIWRRTMAPEAYAPLIECPVLFLSGTNDFHGKMDWAYETLGAMKAPWRAAFTPRCNHHVAEAQGRNLPLWMDRHLHGGKAFPKTPQAKVSLAADGVPVLTVRPDASQKIKRVEVFYAIENCEPRNRYWRAVRPRRSRDAWMASLPVMNTDRHLFAFAQVHYEPGMCLASNFEAVIPAELGEARATDKPSLVIGDFAKDLDGFHTSSTGTDPVVFRKGLGRAKGPDRRFGVTPLAGAPVATRKLGDPKWRGGDGAKLAFQVCAPQDITLKVSLKCHEFKPGARHYQATVPLKARKAWQSVRLAAGDFAAARGATLKGWQEMEKLEISAASGWPKRRPIFTNFRWIKPS
ncbi:MAG: alpha/beta hydrolase family protein [Planctomycetota bacterium]|jgi:hypothetical protein